MFDFRTDLADERTDLYKKRIKKEEIDGIKINHKKINEKIELTTVEVLNENGSKKIDKQIGKYTTINIENIELIDEEEMDKVKEICSKEISKMIKNDKPILVVGLGNEEITADSIGYKVIKDLSITRHIFKYSPELISDTTREVSAITPGVLGTTGIETQEIIKGVVEKIDIGTIIVIDALATNDISRLLKTIQICDTGIVPGGGVNNKRKEISYKTMGVPVIAIGVPTVVEAATIVANSIDILANKFDEFNFLKDSTHEEIYKLIKLVLEPAKYNLAVMPKEIDELVDNMKEIIASGINEGVKISKK